MKTFLISMGLCLFLNSPNTLFAQPGAALNFDGVDDYVGLGTTLGNFGTGDFSIELWVKTTQSNTTPLVTKRGACSHANFWNIIMNNGKIYFEVDENGANYLNISSPASYNDGTYHHIACTRAGTALKIYVDGALVVSGTAPGVANVNSATALEIGRLPCGLFTGSIDELRIWSRLLSPAEIVQNKNCELNAAVHTGVAALYHFNQGTAAANNAGINTATDASGNSNTGALTNFSLTGSTSNWVALGAVTTGTSCSLGVVDYLVVAGGGGGGGDAAGGGGGGGVLSATGYSISGTTNITVTVGGGGVGGVGSTTVSATNGGNSSFGAITAFGGGCGGKYNSNPGNAGGSGGGGAYFGAAGGAGTAGQGNTGGIGNGGNPGAGGGGGGAGGVGANGNVGGVGGVGVASSINGISTYYAGGGGGGRWSIGAEGINNVSPGGGGRGAGSCAADFAVAGTANTGGGGGGAPAGCQNFGAAGGSGVVIIKYLGTPVATGGTITQVGGYTIHTFTSSGTFMNVPVINYYPLLTHTDLSQTSNWTTDVTGVASGGGTAPTNFTSANQVFNVNRLGAVLNNWTISGGSNLNVTAASRLVFGPLARFTIGTSSTADFINNPVTFRSTAAGTASIGTIAGTLSNATNVTVERFIPDDGHRAWRLLSVPTTGSQTIYQAWQDTAKNYTGYGTLITSNVSNGSNGFDMSSNSSSILQHVQAGPSWVAPVNTNATTLSSQQGWMLFVRGDRNATPLNSLHAATTLRSTGTLKQGNQTAVTVLSTGTGYTLVGNPYASPIDFEAIAGTTNLNQSFYIWDANLAGTYGIGGFRTVERTGLNTYQQTPQIIGGTVADNTMRYIHSGQAVFLKATGSNASVVFTEASKASQVPSVNPFRETSFEPQLIANLLIVDANNNSSLADGIRVKFDNSYSPAVTGEDITKMTNFSSENFGLKRDGQVLIVEKRPEIISADTLYLNLANAAVRNYRLQVQGSNMPPTLVAYLVDNYLGTQTVIDLSSTTDIDFNVSSVAASYAADRFMIVFRTASTLPITLNSIRAYEKGNDIAVEWNVQNESEMHHYEVEKSLDGRTFSKASSIAATGNNSSAVSYSWIDINANAGNNFYRIRSLGVNGEVKLSAVVKVNISKGKAGYAVYPNPIVGNVINLQLINQQKGVYNLRLMNNLGQLMLRKKLTHEQGSSSETIELNNSIQKGNYVLEVTAPDKSKRSIKIIY